MGGKYSEQDEIHELSLQLVDQLPAIDRVGMHYRRGRSLNWRRDIESAELEAYKELSKALELVNSLIKEVKGADLSQREDQSTWVNAIRLKSEILSQLGIFHANKGNFPQALSEYNHSLKIAEQLNDHFIFGRTYTGISNVKAKIGSYPEALQAAHNAHMHFQHFQKKEARREVLALSNIGSILRTLGTYAEAEKILLEAIDYSDKIFGGKGQGTQSLRNNLGRVFHLQGKRKEAIQVLKENLTLNSDHPSEVFNRAYLAMVYIDEGEIEEAANEADQALAIARRRRNKEGEALSQMVISQILIKKERLEEALEANDHSLNHLKDGEFEGYAWHLRAEILKRLGQTDEAFACATKAREVVETAAAKIEEKKYRETFLHAVEINRKIMELWLELKAETIHAHASAGIRSRVGSFLDRLKNDSHGEVVPEIPFPLSEPGKIEWEDKGSYAIGRVFFEKLPLESVLGAVFSSKVHIDKNLGQFPDIWAKDVRLTLFFGADGKLYVYLNWSLGMDLPYATRIQILNNLHHSSYYEELLVAEPFRSQDGAIHIELNRNRETQVTASTGFSVKIEPELRADPDQFGWLKWRFNPLSQERTELNFSWEKKMFTFDLKKILETYIKSIFAGGGELSNTD